MAVFKTDKSTVWCGSNRYYKNKCYQIILLHNTHINIEELLHNQRNNKGLAADR